jgi:hypothetical protein
MIRGPEKRKSLFCAAPEAEERKRIEGIPGNSPQGGEMVQHNCRTWSNVVSEMPYISGLLVVASMLMAGLSTTCAQDIEPRAYSNAPVGLNFLIAGYAIPEVAWLSTPPCP